jgi:hypothetical protein
MADKQEAGAARSWSGKARAWGLWDTAVLFNQPEEVDVIGGRRSTRWQTEELRRDVALPPRLWAITGDCFGARFGKRACGVTCLICEISFLLITITRFRCAPWRTIPWNSDQLIVYTKTMKTRWKNNNTFLVYKTNRWDEIRIKHTKSQVK